MGPSQKDRYQEPLFGKPTCSSAESFGESFTRRRFVLHQMLILLRICAYCAIHLSCHTNRKFSFASDAVLLQVEGAGNKMKPGKAVS
jgi:hypothetical protein